MRNHQAMRRTETGTVVSSDPNVLAAFRTEQSRLRKMKELDDRLRNVEGILTEVLSQLTDMRNG